MPKKASNGKDSGLYDVVIIGGGPSGLSAGIYAVRGGMKTILLEGKIPGGQLYNTELVDNYLGFSMVPGYELAQKMEEHVKGLGLKIEMAFAEKISREEDGTFVVPASNGIEYQATSVIYAAGGRPRYLGIPGEQEHSKKGVSYCAVCDGAFFKGEVIAVIGGGDAAAEESGFLTKHAAKVYLIHRRDQLRASHALQQDVFNNEKIEIIWDTVVKSINGTDGVESLTLENVKTGDTKELDVSGVFIFIGFLPNTSLFDFDLEKTQDGYIIVDNKMQSSVPGLFAIGDSRVGIARQIAISAGDGATAAIAADKYVEEKRRK